jgi:hypothetical protein
MLVCIISFTERGIDYFPPQNISAFAGNRGIKDYIGPGADLRVAEQFRGGGVDLCFA